MKKYLFIALAAFSFITLSQSCKKKMKDADIQAAIEAKVKETPEMAGMTVAVKDGVATLSGQCKDDACKAKCEEIVKGMKGVKSVVNNCTITPPPVSTTTTTADPKVVAAIQAAMKDMPGVTVAYEGGKAVFSGTISAKQKQALAQACMAAKIAPDMTKVTIK
ncbi:MAG: BON domain-containing protein [Dinghuibacter sp.]|nr:BON domain-containing protein [Dinghuibacter sp.]